MMKAQSTVMYAAIKDDAAIVISNFIQDIIIHKISISWNYW